MLLLLAALVVQAPAPANVTVTQGPKGGVTVSWSMINDPKATYRVVRAPDPSSPGQDLTTPLGFQATGFTDPSAAPGATYFYRVIVVYGSGVQSASAAVQFPAPQLTGMGLRTRGAVPAPAPAPAPASGPMAVTGGQLTPVGPPGSGPRPPSVWVTGTPAEAHVAWTAAPGASGYTVARWKESDPACCRAQSPMLPAGATGWDDLVQWSGGWRFRVTAVYAPDPANPTGRQGYTDYIYSYPEPVAPSGFQGTQLPDGTIKFTWQPVPKASGYIFAGPPTNTAVRVNATSATVSGVAFGRQTWQLWTQYDPPSGAPAAAASAKVNATVAVAPTGRYRVVAQAIQVSQTTGDAPNVGRAFSTANIKHDGAGDEVFVTSIAQTLKRSDHNVIQTAPIQVSAVHGDVGAWPQDLRVRAGSASGNGGLNPGDVISPVFGMPAAGAQGWPPFILWEGQLTDGFEDLVLHPVLWDADQPDVEGDRAVHACPGNPYCARGNVTSWGAVVATSANGAFLPAAVAAYQSPQIAVVPGQVIWIETDQYFRNLELQQRDRPIGLENDGNGPPAFGVTGRWRDVQVVLSREKIEAALASGNTTISLRMWEHWAMPGAAPTYNTQSGGDYTLVLRLERVP